MKQNDIILFGPSLHTGGGTERVLVTLANVLSERGYTVTILTNIIGSNNIYNLNKSIHVAKYWFGNLRSKYPANILLKIINKIAGAIILNSFIEKHRIKKEDLLISFSAAITNDCFKTKFKKNLISFEHYPYWAYDKYPEAQRQIRVNYPHLKKVIVLTEHEKRTYEQLGCNVIKIPNTYPFFPDIPAALSSKKVLSVGHFNDAKRRDLLIEAWGYVHKIHTDWQLQIVGDGPEKEKCMKMISDLGLNQSISIIDPTDQIEDYYLNSSVFVLSSEFESFSLLLMEAKIDGLPFVSFDIFFCPNELINEAEDGFLVPFPDTKYMSEKICTLIEDLDLRKQMGASGRFDAIKRYNPETIYQNWDNFLTSN